MSPAPGLPPAPRSEGGAAEPIASPVSRTAPEQRIRAVVIGTCAVLVGVLVGVAVATTRSQTGASTPKADLGLDAVQTFEVSQDHVTTPVVYRQTPPVGGEHAPVWLTCGIYEAPVPNENAVHALEHGAVWVTYNPGRPATGVKLLQQAMPDTYAVLSPFPDLPAPVVVSAWGKQLTLTGPQDPRLATFIRAYRQGAQSPEPGAACDGGVGEPIGPT